MIISEQDLRDYLQITEVDSRISSIVNAINSWIPEYTHRHFGEEAEEIEEIHDYSPVIFLFEGDIKDVEEVKVFGEKMNLDNLKINKETGRIRLSTFGSQRYARELFDAVEVKYTVGGISVPEDLKLAALQLGAENYNKSDQADANVVSESVGGYSRTYGRISTKNGSNIVVNNASDYMNVLNFYKRTRI